MEKECNLMTSKVIEKWFFFAFLSYMGFNVGIMINYLITLPTFHAIHLLPLVLLILRNIDLDESDYLDEYLLISSIGFIFGLFLLDFNNYVKFLKTINISAYLLIMVVYLYIACVINDLIKRVRKNA